MIVDNIKVNEITTTGFLRSEHMSVDSSSLKHLMHTLTNLYSDPISAVIREYSTNAYDAHFEAGTQDVSVEITLPSIFSPMFRVKDFGTGLSLEEVYGIYGRYGASTKRESNAYVGQLGLGCKSALTISDQFSMVATKDGVKCAFNISLDEEGIPSINLISQNNTDERNGVEVIIPIPKKDLNQFTKTARYFYYFAPMPVKIDGDPADRFVNKQLLYDISNRIKIYDNDTNSSNYAYNGTGYVVMGGVPYKIGSNIMQEKFDVISKSMELIIHADIGEVNFTPSREDLHYTHKTNEFISAAKKELEKGLFDAVQKKINEEENYLSAYTNAHGLFSSYTLASSFANLNYKGTPLSKRELLKPTNDELEIYSLQYGSLYSGSYHNSEVFNTNNVIILEGNAKSFNSIYKKKFKLWAKENSIPNNSIVFYFSKNSGGMKDFFKYDNIFDGCKTISNEVDLAPFSFSYKSKSSKEIRFERVTSFHTTYGRKKRYNLKTTVDKDIATDKPAVLITSDDEPMIFNLPRESVLFLVETFNLYRATKNGAKRIQKNYKVSYLPQAIKEHAKLFFDSLSEEDIRKIVGTSNVRYGQQLVSLSKKSIEKINDEDVRALYLSNYDGFDYSDTKKKANAWYGMLNTFFLNDKVCVDIKNRVENAKEESDKNLENLKTKVLEKFPLLKASVSDDDILAYINDTKGE